MFKKIEIQNFRAIKKLEIEDLGSVNLLLGENNCSKTSILESLFLLIGCINPEIIIRIHHFRGLALLEENDLRFIFRNLDYENTITIKALSGEKEYRKVEIKPSLSNRSKLQQSEVDPKKISYDSSGESSPVNELSIRAGIKEMHARKKSINSRLTFLDGVFNINTPNKFKDDLRGVYVTPAISLSDNLQKELGNQIINKQHRELIAILKLIDPRIEDISFGSQQMVYVDAGLSRLIPLHLSGDGMRRLLSIILAISSSKNGIVLIDELENGIHYSVLKKTWKAIIGLSKSHNVQLFITTHNVETLKALQEVLLEEEMKDFQKHVRSYTIRNLVDRHKAYKYDFESFEHAVDYGIELR